MKTMAFFFFLGILAQAKPQTINRVGINTTSPEATLDINGDVQVRAGDPQPGKVLTAVNSSGKAEWKNIGQQNLFAGRKLFRATMSNAQYQYIGFTEARINFDTEDYDIGNGYDPVNKRYVMSDSVGSVYQFNICVNFDAQPDIRINVYQNNTARFSFLPYSSTFGIPPDFQARTAFFSVELRCETGNDEVYVTLGYAGQAYIYPRTSSAPIVPITYFSGQKIY